MDGFVKSGWHPLAGTRVGPKAPARRAARPPQSIEVAVRTRPEPTAAAPTPATAAPVKPKARRGR